MKAEFDNATIKVWFSSQHTSRNFSNVVEIIYDGNLALIKTAEGHQHLLNMANVNLLEEINRNKGVRV